MYTFQNENADFLRILTAHRAYAVAFIKGASHYPELTGRILFFPAGDRGILVVSNVRGLPVRENACDARIFAMHIHENGSCTGTPEDPFADAGTHYNPTNCPHPAHAGDLPPLFATSRGKAWSVVLTDRLKLTEILGKSVIIHRNPDDFTTQPAGNSGAKIACGVITKAYRNM